MQLGLFTSGFSCLLIGPSVVLNLPNKIWIILIGISANAFFGVWLVVPVTPEIVESVGDKLKAKWSNELKSQGCDEAHILEDVELKYKKISNKLVDKASALQNMAYALGSGIAPVLGGRLTDVYGWRGCADIIACITLGYAVINFIVVFMIKGCNK